MLPYRYTLSCLLFSTSILAGNLDNDKMLKSVNTLRAQPQVCGSAKMPAVGPLTWNKTLQAVAEEHSKDMAEGDFLSHTGSNDSSPDERITKQGYIWSAWAENVAAGQHGVDAVLEAWMRSEGHCKNMMDPMVTQMGAGFVEKSDTEYEIYWTQTFAKPR
ncbi:CAP domain-containing protein [Vibrio superstes]|uniref:SCP domain-containing protein n=1 Tax=Vibrio superstes NBRC 103154 TaxID=1219062 RepID=A0A511QR03_9VIBR|nr:CAP domain-containing protein [Vibrio superstes]GEM79785.1 hypothetical protein VSU01S_20300 [Vibrio superstes NBRC 103154]